MLFGESVLLNCLWLPNCISDSKYNLPANGQLYKAVLPKIAQLANLSYANITLVLGITKSTYLCLKPEHYFVFQYTIKIPVYYFKYECSFRIIAKIFYGACYYIHSKYTLASYPGPFTRAVRAGERDKGLWYQSFAHA